MQIPAGSGQCPRLNSRKAVLKMEISMGDIYEEWS